MNMKRSRGVVNESTFNPQLTVKLSVFNRLQSLINQSYGVLRHRITAMPFDSPRRSQEASHGLRQVRSTGDQSPSFSGVAEDFYKVFFRNLEIGEFDAAG
jgi:hypothetical protein